MTYKVDIIYKINKYPSITLHIFSSVVRHMKKFHINVHHVKHVNILYK